MIMLRLLSTHHLWVNWQRNPCFIEKSLLIVTMYQSKSPYDIVNLHLWSEKEFLNLDTFKRCDLIGYKDSSLDLSKCFIMITWLWGFLCQLIHGWWVESNQSVWSAVGYRRCITVYDKVCLWLNKIKSFCFPKWYKCITLGGLL